MIIGPNFDFEFLNSKNCFAFRKYNTELIFYINISKYVYVLVRNE